MRSVRLATPAGIAAAPVANRCWSAPAPADAPAPEPAGHFAGSNLHSRGWAAPGLRKGRVCCKPRASEAVRSVRYPVFHKCQVHSILRCAPDATQRNNAAPSRSAPESKITIGSAVTPYINKLDKKDSSWRPPESKVTTVSAVHLKMQVVTSIQVGPPESNITTVSAVARLMPSPPARVDSRNRKYLLGWALKASMRRWRSAVPGEGREMTIQIIENVSSE